MTTILTKLLIDWPRHFCRNRSA